MKTSRTVLIKFEENAWWCKGIDEFDDKWKDVTDPFGELDISSARVAQIIERVYGLKEDTLMHTQE